MAERNAIQVLLNEPVRIVIGTAEAPIEVLVREPSNAELGEYLALMNHTMLKLLKGNAPLIRAAVEGGDVSGVSADLSGLADALELLVAKIVGKDVDYVRNEMTARQNVAVVRAFLDVLGWEFIRENFRQAMRAYQATATTPKSAGPPWPQELSPKSADSTRN